MPLNEAGSEVPGHNASKEVVLTMPDDQNDSSHHYRPAASASSTALARGSSSRAGNATPRARSLARSLAPDIATRDRARGATQRRRSTTGGGGFERAARTPLAPASRAAAAAQRTHDRGGRRVANAWGQPESDFQRASFRASCASGTSARTTESSANLGGGGGAKRSFVLRPAARRTASSHHSHRSRAEKKATGDVDRRVHTRRWQRLFEMCVMCGVIFS